MMLFYFLFLSWITFITTDGCETWVPIPENEYNRTFVSINSPDADIVRPLGFKTTFLEFEGTDPCFVVSPTGGNDRHIEVKWELDLPGTLCFSNSIEQVSNCGTGLNGQLCSTVPGGANSVTYTFLCEGSNCESGVKQFWYRFVVEDPDEEGVYDENWCSTRDSDFPSSLSPIPTITPPTTTSKPGGAAALIMGWKLPSLFVLIAFIVMS